MHHFSALLCYEVRQNATHGITTREANEQQFKESRVTTYTAFVPQNHIYCPATEQ